MHRNYIYHNHNPIFAFGYNGTPLQYSCLEDPMDGGAWKAAVHEVAEGWTWLSDFTFTFHFHSLEKEMATHSSILAWRILWAEEPGGLQSTGSQRVGHDWATNTTATTTLFQMEDPVCQGFKAIQLWGPGVTLGQDGCSPAKPLGLWFVQSGLTQLPPCSCPQVTPQGGTVLGLFPSPSI